MQASRDGSSDAFAELFDRHRAALWGFFRRRVPDHGRAEDLLQDTFVALLKSTGRYEARDVFRRFLFGIAYNVLADERRRAGVQGSESWGQGSQETALAALAAPTTNLTDVLMVRRAIAGLDAIDREVLLLREFEALAYADIAAALDIPLNTVRSRLFRARMALKEKLQ